MATAAASRSVVSIMPLSRSLLAFACFSFGALAGCGSDDESKDPGKSDTDDVVEQDETCTGTLRILQKDAYKDVAGRSSELWPPHTTTVFDIDCGDGVLSTVQANHGTKPDAVDGNGDVFLVQTGVLEVEGTEDDLLDLAVAFEACSCDEATTFLTLDTLDEDTASQLLDRVGAYLEENLICEGTSGDELSTLLASGDVDALLAILPGCTWADGTSLEDGLDQALAELVEATGGLLEDYHVCNNDAALQVELVEQFDASGEIVKCVADAPICHGPTWFYNPLPNEP